MDEYSLTAEQWRAATGTPYKLLPRAPEPQPVPPSSEHEVAGDRERRLALADAVASQSSFAARILRLGPALVDEAFIERAVDRYCQFLLLARENPGHCLVPTLDVHMHRPCIPSQSPNSTNTDVCCCCVRAAQRD